MKSKFFKNLKSIEQLKDINGLSIETIEKRAKAIQDNTSDPEFWRYRSFDGFLGQDETFKSRILKDWQSLDNWNKENNQSLTHIDISNKLKDIINKCEEFRIKNNFGPMAPIKLLYNNNNNNNNNNNKDKKDSNNNNDDLIELLINKNIFNGFQYSLFWNEQSTNEKDKEIWNQKWNIEYKIINIKNQKEILVSGDSFNGIIKYIEYLGFYEGDENNQYRIDPIKFLSLINFNNNNDF